MKKCKILIVEDELIIRQAIKYILESKQEMYDIVGECSNGMEACKMVDELNPDVVISDIIMPVLDGLKLTKYIKTKYPHIHVIILSNYGDFDYVKTCFKYGITEYILKAKLTPESLNEALENICITIGVKPVSNDNSIKAFLEMVVDGNKSIKLPDEISNKNIAVLGVNIKKIIGFSKAQENFYYEILKDKFSNQFEDVIFYLTKNQILICLVETNGIQENFIKDINLFVDNLSEEILGIKLIYSNPVNNKKSLIENIINTNNTALSQFFISNDIICFESINISKQKLALYTMYKNKIEFFEESFVSIHNFLCKITCTDGYTEEDVKKQTEHIIYTCFDYLKENNMLNNNEEYDYFSVMDIIDDIYSLDDLISQIENIFVYVNNSIKNISVGEDNFINKIIDYIKQNSQQQLTLKQVADKFHISYSYLSTYFSHNLGVGYSEYLNKIRVEKAKTMLQSTDLSLNMICEKVGYLDQSYFSKVFKKIVGVSPKAYRREVQVKK